MRELVARDPSLWLSRSWTTRARRPGEPADAYHFVTRDQFEQRIADGGFYEWAEFQGNLMGTPTPELDPGHDLVLEIDVQGAEQVLARESDVLFLFVTAPTPDEQAARLRGRGDDEAHVQRRLAATDAELARADALGAHLVVNDRLDDTVETVASLIDSARVEHRS